MAPVYDWFRKYHLTFQNADVILVNTFYDLEKPVLDALRNQVLGASDIQVSVYNQSILSFCGKLFLNIICVAW